MKKIPVLFLLGILVLLPVSAGGFYFDAGLGSGKIRTKINGRDPADSFRADGVKTCRLAVDIGFKAGYGPFGTIPLYAAVEFSGTGHRISTDSGCLRFSTFMAGPGIIFYPVPFFQIGLSLGYSCIRNDTSIPDFTLSEGKGGFAWNVSAAVDIGRGKQGCLTGVKFFYARNALKSPDTDGKSYMVSLFLKYAFRHKAAG